MSRSLSDLRANKPKAARPERAITICLAPHLVAEVQTLTDQLDDLAAQTTVRRGRVDETGDRTGPPRRTGQSSELPEAAVLRQRLTEVLTEVADNEGELRVRANLSDGEWRRWCDEHPARDKDEPGNDYDLVVTNGYCNADDLVAKLAEFAHTWNGDRLEDGDWATLLEPSVGQADKKAVAAAVVGMYENRLDFRQWRSNLSATLRKSNDASSPEASGSPTDDSTAGSRPPSNAATTATGNKSS